MGAWGQNLKKTVLGWRPPYALVDFRAHSVGCFGGYLETHWEQFLWKTWAFEAVQVLGLLINKIGNNLQQRYQLESVVKKTLARGWGDVLVSKCKRSQKNEWSKNIHEIRLRTTMGHNNLEENIAKTLQKTDYMKANKHSEAPLKSHLKTPKRLHLRNQPPTHLP